MAFQITSLTVTIALSRLFRLRSKRTSKLRVIGLCAGNSPVTGEFPAQMANNAENVFIWWRHHAPHCWASLTAIDEVRSQRTNSVERVLCHDVITILCWRWTITWRVINWITNIYIYCEVFLYNHQWFVSDFVSNFGQTKAMVIHVPTVLYASAARDVVKDNTCHWFYGYTQLTMKYVPDKRLLSIFWATLY